MLERQTLKKDGETFEILHVTDTYKKVYKFEESAQNKMNPDSKKLEVGVYDSVAEAADVVMNYLPLDANPERPMPGDIVLFNEGDWYAATRARIESVGHRWGYLNAVHICANLGSAYHAIGSGFSISGGPFRTLALDSLKPTGKRETVRAWNFGDNGACGGGGVDFEMTVNVWQHDPSVKLEEVSEETWNSLKKINGGLGSVYRNWKPLVRDHYLETGEILPFCNLPTQCSKSWTVAVLDEKTGDQIEIYKGRDGLNRIVVVYGGGFLTDWVTVYDGGKWAADFPDRWSEKIRSRINDVITAFYIKA